MAENQLINIIKDETDTNIVKRNVTNRLHSLVGSLKNPRILSPVSRTNATLEVASLLNEILTRLRTEGNTILFDTCKVCLDYYGHLCELEKDRVDLAHMQSRRKLMASYEFHGRLGEAEGEAVYLLKQIDQLSGVPPPRRRGDSNSILPRLTSYTMNSEVAVLVLAASFTILNVWLVKKDYEKLLLLVNDCDDWYRLVQNDHSLDARYKALRKWMANFLSECTMLLVKKRETQERKITIRFCTETFSYYEKASMDYKLKLKFCRDLSNNMFSRLDDEYIGETFIVEAVLDTMAKETKEKPETLKHFMDLASDCVFNYGGLIDHRFEVAQFLQKLATTHFSEVKHVSLVMEHYAVALVINDFNASKRWFGANSIENVLVKLEHHLENLADINELIEPRIAGFFCERLSTLIISNGQHLLCEVKDDHTPCIQLLKLEEVFNQYIEDFIANSTSQRNEVVNNATNDGYIQQVVQSAVSYFMLALATKQDTEPLKMIMKLTKEGTPKADVLESLYQQLYKMFQVFSSADRSNEAIEILKSCCEIAWSHVQWYCNMLKFNQFSRNFLDDHFIADFVKRASEGSALLLSLVNKYCKKDLNSMLEFCVQSWIDADKEFHISSPVAIIEKWVEIQYEVGKNHEIKNIYSLVPELQGPEQTCGTIILETELKAIRNTYHQNSDVSCRMEMAITNILSEISYSDYILSRSERLIFGGMRLVSCGTKGQTESIQYISTAIDLMSGEINLENQQTTNSEKVNRVLFKAYCSLALCNRIAFPKSKRFIKDIEKALRIWLKQDNLHVLTLSDNDIVDFFYIADLLSLEGATELHANMIRCIVGRDRTLDDLWNLCWQSGNLSHSLCVSVLNEEFIQILLNHSSLNEKVTFWKNCVKSELHKVGVVHTFSLLPTISVDSIAKTVNEVKNVTTTLIMSGAASENPFALSRLYYDVAEKLIANGLMIEALAYANKVYELRLELLSKCFIMEWKGEETKTVVDGNTFNVITYVFQTFLMNPSHVSPHGSYGFGTDNCVYVPTPWNIVKCYLESALQTAAIQEMMGSGDEAEKKLAFGKEISSLLNLPIFLVRFSTALGKIYHTKRYRSLALKELRYAEQKLGTMSSCDKCRIISAAKLYILLGDLYLSFSKIKSNSNEFNMAENYYASAKSKLESEEWKNDVSVPKEASVTNMVFCKASGIPSEMSASETMCWHCQPSIIEKSLLIRDHIDMTWEYTRRSHLLELLSKTGKCAKLKGENENERKQLLSGISMLFRRSTFYKVVLSSSLLEDLVRNNMVADAFGVENASILYKICRFSLKCLFNEDGRTILSRTGVMTGLKLAFILSRQVPPLHQKVSRLLAAVYANFSNDNMLSAIDAAPSVTQWATYFHQASIGAQVDHLLPQDHGGSEGLTYALAPPNVMKLEQHVLQFFKVLPSVEINCISLLKDNSDGLFQNLLSDSPTSTWIMISRLSLNDGVVCVILPIGKTLTGYSTIKGSPGSYWKCPWANGVFDKVAPKLRRILEEDARLRHEYSEYKLGDLDSSLQTFLRDVEKSWLGPWKQLLLGQWSDYKGLDDIVLKLKEDLEKTGHITDVDERYLKLVIEGAGDDYIAEPMTELLVTKGCFISKLGSRPENDRDRVDVISNELKNALRKMQLKKYQCREPVIIVPDLNIQMLPWENLPVLRRSEVYRMPSVGFIVHRTSANRNSTEVPMVDPCNRYYLINPSSNLNLQHIETIFKRWSKTTLGIDGDANTVPPLDKLRKALTERELFVYVGHSSGRMYIPSEEIRKIERCASALLMGCGSGYINSTKTCTDGAPLDYLLAGSCVVVGNLWRVYASDVQKLTSALFGSWVKAKSARLASCNVYNKSDINAQGTQTLSRKRKLYDEASIELVDTSTYLCKHEFNLGSFIPGAREACNRKYLTGAAPVIFGVPACIDKKKCN